MNQRTLILFTLAAVNFTHIIDVMLIMPLGDIFLDLFDINAAQFSFLVSAYALGAFSSSILAIFKLDGFDRKKALLFVFTGFIIGTFLCAFASTYLMLLLLRLGTGFFGGVMGALVLSIVADIYPFQERGKAIGTLMAAFSAASALGVPVGLYFAFTYSWQMPFIALGILGFVILLIIYFTFPKMTGHFESLDKDRNLVSTVKAITTDKNQINALLLGFVLILGHFMIIPFIAPYMSRNVGFEQEQLTWIYLVGGVLTIFTSPFVGKLTDRFGVNIVFNTAMILSFIPVIMITTMGKSPVWYALIFTGLFFVLGSGRMIPPNTIITAAAGVSNRGSFMSVKSALQQLAVGLASFIAGGIVVLNDDGTFSNYEYVGIASIIICLFSFYLIRRLKIAKGN
jgi:predicted MFS family arabinose efflux permease